MKIDFNEYIKRYSCDLTRLCISLCKNTAEAEDLFQETWCKAIKNQDKYNDSMSFEKWLYAICVNTFKNTHKLFYNRFKINFSSEEEQTAFFNSIPDFSIENSDEYFELHKIISSLPKKQKVVIILHYFKSYTAKEIAQMLNISEGTVKSRLHYAKEYIKRRLENEK
ncbi:MAG: sigma-70 family RNA polymerase sigma factor [bacterium]|nr:sigma-70 family RNA polymerase sigma factor [bacterium]MDD6225703.1 sigma-70 family RNA polymerase sigma factor [bacterium]MDY3861656.1 sigma-70 family RNA polymerase sigma factor [Ruminococcus sp.]